MLGNGTNGIIAVLDIGSSKVCCLIASVPKDRRVDAGVGIEAYQVRGFGHHRSRGVKSGVIVDLDAAERAVRAAVAQAEHEAGVRIENVYVGVACGRLKSLNFRAHAELGRGVVGVDDLAGLWDGAREYVANTGRMLVSLNEVDYVLDGQGGVPDPRGLAGRKIAADLHAVLADAPPLRNLQALVRRCFLDVSAFIPSGLASALAATTPEEREAGVIAIDIGGGVMTTVVFAGGKFLHTDLIPFGASHISQDIARDLGISFDEAEWIKTMHGSVLHAASDETDLIGYNAMLAGRPARQQVVRGHIRRLIEHRLRLLMQMVGEQLSTAEIARFADPRIVLTGGGSQLLGIAEFTAAFLERPVRVGGPPAIMWGGDLLQSPAFSSIFGMLTASQAANHLLSGRSSVEFGVEGSLGRVGRWLRESF